MRWFLSCSHTIIDIPSSNPVVIYYPLVNKHRAWKSPIVNGHIHLPTPIYLPGSMFIYQRVDDGMLIRWWYADLSYIFLLFSPPWMWRIDENDEIDENPGSGKIWGLSCWLVVSNMFFFFIFHHIWDVILPNWLTFFRGVGQPSTR